MALKTYNGFSGAERQQSYDWLKREMATGRIPQPEACIFCRQTEGPIVYHAEDYSRPYGPHIWAYPVCWLCHMIIHCRFSRPEAFEAYKAVLNSGRRFKPIGRNWGRFCSEFLGGNIPEPGEVQEGPVDHFEDVLHEPPR